MRTDLRHFKFQNIYRVVSLIEECVVQTDSMLEIFWENPEAIQKIGKFSKISNLHEYVFAMINVEERRYFRKNSDLFDDEMIEDLCHELNSYSIQSRL